MKYVKMRGQARKQEQARSHHAAVLHSLATLKPMILTYSEAAAVCLFYQAKISKQQKVKSLQYNTKKSWLSYFSGFQEVVWAKSRAQI